MKRLLVIAGDRALTKFVAEALLGRSLNTGVPRTSDPWDIARAHSAVEAHLLVTRGGRPFDVILVDQGLPDQDPLAFVDKLRKTELGEGVPVFLMTERGRDVHSRRIASERYSVAGFIEKPVTAESIRTALTNLERKLRILLVETNPDLAERYRDALNRAGYSAEIASRGREALDRFPRLRPDVVISALNLEDMRGADVCVEIKRGRNVTPVVLYGQVAALASQEISENAHRADDFIQAPFDDEILVERIAQLVGRGASQVGRRPRRALNPASQTQPGDVIAAPTHQGRSTSPGETYDGPKATKEDLPREDVGDTPPAPPPPSASPAPTRPSKRSTRRVPCNISISIRNGQQIYSSKTLDISHGGIFLAIDEPLEIGQLIDMTFQIPNTSKVVNAVGKIAWVGKHPDGAGGGTLGVGVKFSKIDPSDLQAIVDYVNRVARVVYSAS